MVTKSCAAFVLCTLAAMPALAQVEIDNAWVRVSRIHIAPHEKAAVEPRLPAVGVVLGDLREGGKLRKWGDVYSLDAKTARTDENTGNDPSQLVLIELKPGAPKSPAVKLDPVRLDPAHHIVVLENDRVRAIRTILIPHLKSPLHEHPHYVVVYLTVLHTTMTLADGRKIDNPRKPGDIAWRDALSHVTENIGDRTAEEIQVELK